MKAIETLADKGCKITQLYFITQSFLSAFLVFSSYFSSGLPTYRNRLNFIFLFITKKSIYGCIKSY